MYVGRFLIAAPGVGAYRVSSRSFPNRKIVARGETLTVVPTADAEPTENPYVSYNCLRQSTATHRSGLGPFVTLGNGSHVDPIHEKLSLGYPPRDALATGLLTLDYEKDDYDTPRIGAIIGADDATVGIVRRDALIVRSVPEPTIVATYELDAPEPKEFPADTAAGAARAAYDLDYEHAVCAAGVTVTDGVDTGIVNGGDD